MLKDKVVTQIYNAKDILEDKDSVTKTSNSNMAARAFIGGAISGGVGAVIGGVTASKNSKQVVNSIVLRVLTTNIDDPVKDFVFLNKTVKKNTSEYHNAIEQATEWFGTIKALMHTA